MRILQIIQKKQYRGAEIFACQLSNHLIKFGHQVEVVSIYDGDALLPFKNKIPTLSSQDYNRYLDLQGWKKLANIIGEFKPDIIQANAADTLKYTVLSKLIFKWKTPIIYRNASIPSYYIKSYFSKFINKLFLRQVDFIISVSYESRKDLNKLYPFTKLKSSVIPIGIEIEQKYDPISFSKKNKNIIHIGSFTREKNHDELIDIFYNSLKENSSLILHLIGEGPLRTKIENKIELYEIKQKVKLYGGISDPPSFISQADLLILPSIIEGLPAVLLEAMYYKIPIVAYNVGGISQIISNETGSLIDKNDPEAFTKSILDNLKLKDQKKIAKAYKLVEEKYLNKQIALQFIVTYSNVLDISIK